MAQLLLLISRLRHQWPGVLVVAVSYLIVAKLSFQLADNWVAVLPIWPPAGYSHRTGQTLRLRIGINTGPVIARVIGTKNIIYDLWGDTVNTASRMESFGVAEQIQVTETTYNCLKDTYDFELRGEIWVKGKGPMHTYFLRQKSVATVAKPL